MSTVDCSNQTNTATLNRIQFNDLATATNQLAPSKYRNKTTICASIDLLPTIVELSDKNFDEIDLKSNKKSVSIGTDTNSNSNIDSSQRLCRICQSDSGRLVRPCACSGTMADVHEHCLSMWLVKSKKRDQRCEICKDEYAISGKQLKPICQWIRPNLSSNTTCILLMCIALVWSNWYILTLIVERQTYERIVIDQLTIRYTDVARIVLLIISNGCLVQLVLRIILKLINYIRAQKIRRFIDSPKHHA